MLELKFRAWDNKTKSFYKPVYEAYNGKLHELIMNIYGNRSIRTMDGVFGIEKDDYVFMQYTGLLDNNGVEIYDGDIVKMDDEAIIKPNKILQVIHDGFCTFYLAEYDYYIAHLSEGVNDRLGNYKQKHGLAGEVIGNIYQNPGLLN